jgi:hypothetical protein
MATTTSTLHVGEIASLGARVQCVSGTLLGIKPASTKDGRAMYTLRFADGSINMMESADHPQLDVGLDYTARWVNKEFTIVAGIVDLDAVADSDESEAF